MAAVAAWMSTLLEGFQQRLSLLTCAHDPQFNLAVVHRHSTSPAGNERPPHLAPVSVRTEVLQIRLVLLNRPLATPPDCNWCGATGTGLISAGSAST